MNNIVKSFGATIVGILIFLCSTGASATIINPNPGAFHDDNDAELFSPISPTISIEIADPFSGEFGFYFEGDSSNRVTIFDNADTAGNVAAIDFDTGVVLDVDDSSLQGVFAVNPADIGFYLTLGGATIFSEAALNPFGLDWVATFQDLTTPTNYLIGFEVPINGALTTVAFHLVGGVTAVVPEGSSIGLLLLSFVLLAGTRLRSRLY